MTEETIMDVMEDEATLAEKPESEADTSNESKADKFKRLATNRVNNAIKQIENLGKLSTSAYEYTDEQIDMIEGALREATDNALSKLRKTKKTSQKFSF